MGLLRTLWRLSYQDMHDWLKSWPQLALACGLPVGKDGQPRIPSKSQQCKRRHAAGAPLHEALFVLTVWQALQSRLIGARDLIIDSAPILSGAVRQTGGGSDTSTALHLAARQTGSLVPGFPACSGCLAVASPHHRASQRAAPAQRCAAETRATGQAAGTAPPRRDNRTQNDGCR